jgi:hypothetical protein
MQREFVFRIKEIGVRKWHVVRACVDVPENWDSLDEGDQRNYLTRPNGYNIHYARHIAYADSRFETLCDTAGIFGCISDFKYYNAI